MVDVVLVSHGHEDHLPVPGEVRDKIVVCPNRVDCSIYVDVAEVRQVALYRRASLPNRRHVIYIPGDHGNYVVLLWRDESYFYVGDLNYNEDKKLLGWLSKLLKAYGKVTLILPIYGGISAVEAKRRHKIPEDAEPRALAGKVSDIAGRAREMGVKRILGVPHPLFSVDWADEVAEKAFTSLSELARKV